MVGSDVLKKIVISCLIIFFIGGCTQGSSFENFFMLKTCWIERGRFNSCCWWKILWQVHYTCNGVKAGV